MSAKPANQPAEDTTLDAEVTAIVTDLLEEHGSERAALRALAHDFIVLQADADRSVSRGYLRGLFSQGARPDAEKE
jgi:alpha-D-ribose 1-methylphosphonate 5-triphosphate synthase subunit PhnL